MVERLTPKQLRDVAWTLDHLGRLTADLLRSIATGHTAGADEVTVTYRLRSDDEPLSREAAELLLEWVAGTGMQESLRAMADHLEHQEAS